MKLSTKGKKEAKKPKFSQKNILIIIAILTFILIIGYLQKPLTQEKSEIKEEPKVQEEPKELEQLCTELWICKDANTKAYRKSDCTFEQITDCPAGCENAECKEVIEEPKLGEPKEETKEETKEKCTIGYKCLDDKRLGYQSSNCVFSQVIECKYGCKNGECTKTAPPEEEKEETYTLTQGKVIMNRAGWKYSDFSKNQIFEDVAYDQDFKIKLYASASDYDYFRAESYRSDLWIIEKGIEEATRSDCMEKIIGANAYMSLRTGQTLCIETREKNIALVGGYWEGLPEEDTELAWKYYS